MKYFYIKPCAGNCDGNGFVAPMNKYKNKFFKVLMPSIYVDGWVIFNYDGWNFFNSFTVEVSEEVVKSNPKIKIICV